MILLPLWGLLNVFRRLAQQPEFRGLVGVEFLLILSGAIFYHTVEGWAWLDAVYFCVVTLATVGYGDLHPTTTWGKLFTIPYIIVGVGLLGVFLHLAGKLALESIQERAQQRQAKKSAQEKTEGETK